MKKIVKHPFLHALKIIFVLALFTYSYGFSAQKAANSAEKVGTQIDKKVNNGVQYLDDTSITAIIKAEILKDPITKIYEINVSTTNGIVELTGVVDSQRTIDRALEIVRSNHSVSAVKNNLFIKTTKLLSL